jgi:hypothetical protein
VGKPCHSEDGRGAARATPLRGRWRGLVGRAQLRIDQPTPEKNIGEDVPVDQRGCPSKGEKQASSEIIIGSMGYVERAQSRINQAALKERNENMSEG